MAFCYCESMSCRLFFFFFFQAEDGIRDLTVTGVQTCALPISLQHGTDRVPLVEVLAVVLLPVGDDRLGLAELREHHHDLAALDLLHLARQELAHLARELFADAGALPLAHTLDDALLSRLHRRAPEHFEADLFLHHVPDLAP